MFVLGTAGHVDHGKSALVRALTGIDPDRLREEKERGMTIDLGFAWLQLPSGREVSIVDVPGHERFVRNMLAGVGGIDLALLVVAADEGFMPQTREHLAILDLLRIQRGIVVITKKDLVDRELLELVALEAAEAIKPTTLGRAPILATSAATGEGLPDLLTAIDRLLEAMPPRRDIGRPRLPIDRVFTMAGFGTVVTGTLIDGCLSLGQEVEIAPVGLKARIRGLQTHRRKVETALPGSRVAANLAGVATQDLQRGYVLTMPGWLRPARALDVRLRLLAGAPRPLLHNASVSFHTGAAEAMARVRLLDREALEPGEVGWAQLVLAPAPREGGERGLARPLAVAGGDLFIIRSTEETLGGGEVIDPYARRHRRFHAATLEGLEARSKGSPEDAVLAIIQAREPAEWAAVRSQCGLSAGDAEAALQTLLAGRRVVALGGAARRLVLSAAGWERLAGRAAETAGDYHRQFPLRRGLAREELRSRLKLPDFAFAEALGWLVAEGVLAEDGALVRLPGHRVQLSPEQERAIEAFLKALAESPYSPPGEAPEPELLNLLVERGQVVRVSENVAFGASAYARMVEGIKARLRERGKITLAEVRDMFGASRKYAQALLEYLDSQKVTRRVGDERVLR